MPPMLLSFVLVEATVVVGVGSFKTDVSLCLVLIHTCTRLFRFGFFCVLRQAWTLEVSPDGSFVLSGGHDRSLRLWRRTEEMVFLEEEREKEMEGLFESELDRDDVAAPGADGLAPPPNRKPEGDKIKIGRKDISGMCGGRERELLHCW